MVWVRSRSTETSVLLKRNVGSMWTGGITKRYRSKIFVFGFEGITSAAVS